ncbi:PSD1 and planctomycete cytochrome C domain-containing protein [Horticoccus sp. 23ND18S-11]|uniref:PSD1 and planctomycete cytochrome C domain-containing protein n=1 Tax=Horticoccus sp. 23ND18S-11 TaxID=3391832 RepID=UPI0039C9B57A
MRSLSIVIVGAIAAAGLRAAEQPPTAEGLAFFEKKIRPVLVDKCYQCHSADAEKIRGGLVLDTREGIRSGGDGGPAIVPGDLSASLLIEAIHYKDDDFAMPPEKKGGKLPDAVIADFETWVKMGAPDPREASGLAKKATTAEKGRDYWAFQPPKREPAPAVENAAWPRNDIDRHILAGLAAKGLTPVGDADKAAWLRRVYFDLIGLPPPPDEVTAFLSDKDANAFEKIVDRLLRSPQFGEKWGRHWLDVARYAESTGKDINLAYPHAWRYRDYVIAAFNQDKPYDQFLREQLAGDLLPAKDDKQRAEQLVATGFLALGTKSVNQANPRQFALDLADEQVDTVSQALLGVTAACARCHDHKFDPISQRDYYSLAGIFLSTETRFGTFFAAQNRSAAALIELPKGAAVPVMPRVMTAQERQRKQAELDKLRKEATDMANATYQAAAGGAKRGPRNQQQLLLLRMNQVGLLEAELASFDADGKMRPLAMGVQDQPAQQTSSGGNPSRRKQTPRYESSTPDQAIASRLLERDGRFARPPEFRVVGDSPLFERGDVAKPAGKVARGFLPVLTHEAPPKIRADSSGRRELAEWMLAASNPLTARVMVNRTWLWLFGQGLVTTPDNFGTTGTLPSNQALLDMLAVKFREDGWSVKTLIREIVTSRAYQLSSTFDEKNFTADPENTLNWRMSQRRLEAESIRDAILAASGQLDLRPPVGSPIAERGDGPIGQFRQFPNAGVPEDVLLEAGSRTAVRSVYLPIARELLPDALAVFDFAEPGFVNGHRETTTVPSQALFMLNSSFIATASQKLAERVIAAYPQVGDEGATLAPRVQLAYRLALSREPSETELQAAMKFFAKFSSVATTPDADAVATQAASPAWTSFCRVLFAGAEFRFLK